MTTIKDEPGLNEADQKELEKIIAADDRGEIEYILFEEFDRNMKNFLKSLAAQNANQKKIGYFFAALYPQVADDETSQQDQRNVQANITPTAQTLKPTSI